MSLIILIVVAILNLMLSGAWIGSIVTDRANDREVELPQYLWSIGCFVFGVYALITCIGHVAVVK